MQTMKPKSRIAFLAITLALIPTPAFAYIDPAIGSMVFQAFVGAIAVAGTAWYTLRQKVTEFFKGSKVANTSAETEGK